MKRGCRWRRCSRRGNWIWSRYLANAPRWTNSKARSRCCRAAWPERFCFTQMACPAECQARPICFSLSFRAHPARMGGASQRGPRPAQVPITRSYVMSETGTQITKMNPLQYVSDQLNDLRAKGVAPKLRVLEGEQKPVCIFDGKEVINLASNNYLGLTTHKALRKAALDAVKRYGAGAGRTIAGTMKIHMELEEQIAAFKNVEACVVFQSGFTANAGTVSAVLGKDDLIVSDELNHASIIDGARLSKSTINFFKHKDVQDCERILQEPTVSPGKKLIISDGVFSMDGDIAPLPELCDLAEKYNCIMMVDDAHASGVLG